MHVNKMYALRSRIFIWCLLLCISERSGFPWVKLFADGQITTFYQHYLDPQYSTTKAPTTSLVQLRPPCTPVTNPEYGRKGICVVPSNIITICGNMYITTSDDCSYLNNGNSVCCYGNYTATFQPTTAYPMSTTTSPKPDSGTYDQSMLTWVKEQVCGIPNGDPNLFDAVEGLNSSQLIRGAVPKTVVNSAAKFHQSRFTVQQTIVGGFEAPNGSASICWQVSIVIVNKLTERISVCGGTIIGARTILTAGHCIVREGTVAAYNRSSFDFFVRTGVITRDTNSETELHPSVVANCSRDYDVTDTIVHPEFNSDSLNNDIALLILPESIDFRVHSACACKLCLNKQIPKVGDKCIASGFGREQSILDLQPPREQTPLKYVLQTILPSDRCSYAETTQGTNLDLVLCAGGALFESSCIGDSGGPLFCYNSTSRIQYLAGIVSFGKTPCGIPIGYGYTKVGLYLPWIFNNAPLGDITVMF